MNHKISCKFHKSNNNNKLLEKHLAIFLEDHIIQQE